MAKNCFQVNPEFAQMIVNAAKEIVRKDINFIQLDGKVIASTDPLRVGTFHEAALQVKKRGGAVAVTDHHRLKGARKGMNYPVVIDGQLLGVIGISGDPEECEAFGFLLTKMTEVLIKEQMIASRDHSLDQIRSSVVRMLIFESEKQDGSLAELMQQLHYELEESVFVSLIHLHGMDHHPSLSASMHSTLLRQGMTLFTYLFPNQYVVILNASQYNRAMQAWTSGFRSLPMHYTIGVGNVCRLEEVASSFRHARIALKYALMRQTHLCEYSTLDLEMIIENIGNDVRKDYVQKVIGGLSEEEIKLLTVYFKNNFSLNKSAEELYIHKNTLQYRLHKIAEKTGLDPRDYHHSVKLYLALLLRN
jgi:carbohydrate diacid regulator